MPFIDLPDRTPGLRAQARGDRPWYRIANQSADEAEVMLYDEVGGWLGATADEFIADLRGITAPNILLRVNSPGGQVYEGIAIANALRAHPANVTVQVDGLAASIASVIAMAGDQVRMMPNAMLMLHEASGLTVGNAADHRDTADLLDKISGNIADAYAARAGGTRDEWRQVMVDETWYTAEEAVAAGLADEAVPAPKRGDSPPEMRKEFDLAAYGYAGPPKPAAPKPGPPPARPEAKEEPAPTLVISIADVLDEDTVARLRAAVQTPTNVSPEPVGTGQGETPAAGADAAPPEANAPAATPDEPGDQTPTPATTDLWASQIAHLTAPDDWTALTSHLTASSVTGA